MVSDYFFSDRNFFFLLAWLGHYNVLFFLYDNKHDT